MKRFFLVLITLFAVSSINGQTPNTAVITNLSSEAFKDKIATDKTALIIDLRTNDEIAKGQIPGAVQIDYLGKDFDAKMASLDKNKTYYIYCQAGGRSGDAAQYMEKQGFKKVFNLEKGFSEWKAKGLPIDKK